MESGGGLKDGVDSETQLDEDDEDGEVAIVENLIEMIVGRSMAKGFDSNKCEQKFVFNNDSTEAAYVSYVCIL